jgi:hypothetical protein
MANRTWQGNMRLSNVVSYLAEQLRVPAAALDLQFKWLNPKTGKVETLQGADLSRPVSDLRVLWDT